MNRRYYIQRSLIHKTGTNLLQLLNSEHLKDKKKAKFIGLPSLLVFPTIFVRCLAPHSDPTEAYPPSGIKPSNPADVCPLPPPL